MRSLSCKRSPHFSNVFLFFFLPFIQRPPCAFFVSSLCWTGKKKTRIIKQEKCLNFCNNVLTRVAKIGKQWNHPRLRQRRERKKWPPFSFLFVQRNERGWAPTDAQVEWNPTQWAEIFWHTPFFFFTVENEKKERKKEIIWIWMTYLWLLSWIIHYVGRFWGCLCQSPVKVNQN